MSRQFHLGDILSITTGYLVSPNMMGGVYDIIGYLINDDSITTIGLLVVNDSCREALLGQHPQLAGVDCSGLKSPEACARRVAELAEIYGEYLPVEPIRR